MIHQLQPARAGSACRAHASIVLDVIPRDTTGHSLRLHRGPTSHQPVAWAEVEQIGAVVRLEVLAASHRVCLRSSSVTSWEAVETVACSSGSAPPAGAGAAGSEPPSLLPTRDAWTAGPWEVIFGAELASGPAPLARARASVAALAGDGRALVACFPGHPDAITALVVDARPLTRSPMVRLDRSSGRGSSGGRLAVGWRTWHLYPGRDPHVVTTATTATTVAHRPAQGPI